LAVRSAFVHGMDSMLLVCGGIALCAMVLSVIFLPSMNDESKKPASFTAKEPKIDARTP